MKRDKLYTANKWNQPAFMPKGNIFWPGGDTNTPQYWNNMPSTINKYNTYNPYVTPGGNSFSTKELGVPSSTSGSIGNGHIEGLNLPVDVSSGKTSGGLFKNMSGALKEAGTEMATAGIGMLGNFAGNALSGGYDAGATGQIAGTIASTGLGIAGTAIGGPIGGAIGSALGSTIGGLVNRAFGTKVDEAKKKAVEAGINKSINFNSNASSFDDVQGPEAIMTDTNVAQGGWFSGGKADRINRELKEKMINAKTWASRSVNNNISNLADDQMNNALANYAAFGGSLDTMNDRFGTIGFNFMDRYFGIKEEQNRLKNKVSGMNQMPAFMNGFAIGGDLQTNGSDFTNGLSHIDEGGSHSENPYGGVQMGVDNEGTPNLVEEGETVFDDYVYSARILADAETKKKFHLPKKKEISFADISKRLEKEAVERPNDPISKAGLKVQMQALAEEQERQKAEMEAERAKAAFEALSPEEQTALMQRAAQEEQMAQEATMQQEAMAQQGISPEEAAMAQQQMQADGSQAMIGQESQIQAYGGNINKFDLGGQAYNKMLNSLGFHTQSEFEKWAEEEGIDFGDLWKNNPNTLSNEILSNLWKNEKFKEAFKKKNPALFHAFDTKGYDFGLYQPEAKDRATIQSISKGNWKATNGQGWFGSEDLAFKQATEGLSDDEIKALTTEQLAERMAKTDAYKNTNKWLENSDNALMYLNTLIEDPNTPEVAKKHALQYVKNGKWKDGYTYNYNDVFGKVRATNPGTYWHTAMEANRGNQTGNFVINDDGTIEEIRGDVPTDWTSAGNYAWTDPENNYTYNYYKRPAVTTPAAETDTPGEEVDLTPKRNKEWFRYLGLLGPSVGLGMMAAGVGKPDHSNLDAAVSGAGNYTTADWMPIDTRVKYQPNDPWFYTSPIMAESRATARAIDNGGGNAGSKNAARLANSYNTTIALGNATRQQLDSNYDRYMKARQMRGAFEEANQREFGQTSRFNAGAYNDANRASTSAKLQAASQKAYSDAGWYNSLYGNVNGLFKGLSDLGTENKRENMINWMLSKGIFGSVDTEDPEIKKRVKVKSKD